MVDANPAQSKRAADLTTADTVIDQNGVGYPVLDVECDVGRVRVVAFDRTLVYGPTDQVRVA